MVQPFAEVLARLRSPACGTCRHEVGTAWFLDEAEYDRLGSLFDEAVAEFTSSDGPPLDPVPRFPGLDVERAACWRRGEAVLYVVLSWGDNTRCRSLTLGLARRGTVVAGCWGSDA